jgi:hypothetical protein
VPRSGSTRHTLIAPAPIAASAGRCGACGTQSYATGASWDACLIDETHDDPRPFGQRGLPSLRAPSFAHRALDPEQGRSST